MHLVKYLHSFERNLGQTREDKSKVIPTYNVNQSFNIELASRFNVCITDAGWRLR